MLSHCRCFEYVEEMIFKQEPLLNVLRFLILFSVTNSGLPKKHFDYLRQVDFTELSFCFELVLLSKTNFWLRRELLQSYGFEHIATLDNLEKAGLFRKQVKLDFSFFPCAYHLV